MAGSARAVNKATWAALEAGDLEGALTHFHDDVLFVTNGRRMEGKAALRSHWGPLFAAFTQMKGDIVWEICTGGDIVTEQLFSASHSGDLVTDLGLVVPATGRRVAFSAVTMQRVRDGLVVEEREVSDTGSLLAQLRAEVD